MFDNSYEITGLILIIAGLIYEFRKKGDNKKSEEAEFVSKVFTLKGGPGIIFTGLGVLLIIVGAVQSPPVPSSPNEINPTITKTPAADITVTKTPANKVTSDYLIGKWEFLLYTFTFNPDGSFIFNNSGALFGSPSDKGRYSLTDSKIQLNYDSGKVETVDIIYIDENTFQWVNATYRRIR